MCHVAQAEKNLAWEAAQQQAQAQAQLNAMGAQAGSGPCKLLVTNLNVQIAVSLHCCCCHGILGMLLIPNSCGAFAMCSHVSAFCYALCAAAVCVSIPLLTCVTGSKS